MCGAFLYGLQLCFGLAACGCCFCVYSDESCVYRVPVDALPGRASVRGRVSASCSCPLRACAALPCLDGARPEPPSVLILVLCCVAVPVLRRWLCCELGDICLTPAAGDCGCVCGAAVVHVACLLSESAQVAGCIELSECCYRCCAQCACLPSADSCPAV